MMIFFAICFSVGIVYFSAIQRFRDLHELRKTEIDDKTSRITIIQGRIYNDTDNFTEKTSNSIINDHLSSFHVGVTNSSAIQRYRNHGKFRKTSQNDHAKTMTPRDKNIPMIIFNNTNAVREKTFDIFKASDVEIKFAKDKTTTASSFWNFIRFVIEQEFLTEISSTGSSSATSMSTAATSMKTLETASLSPKTDTPILRTATKSPPFGYTNKKLLVSKLGCAASCGSCVDITSMSGIILSPNYPDHYYSPTDIGYTYCQYTINAPEGKKIHLVFQELNLAFTDWGDFLEVIDKSPDNHGKVLATFNAGDDAVATTTSGESMFIFFEGNHGGFTKNGKVPSWKATYYVVEK